MNNLPYSLDASVTDSPAGRCRVLYLIAELRTGGAEQQLFYLCQALDRDRYRPAVIVWNSLYTHPYGPRIEALGVPVYTLPKTPNAIAKLEALRALVKRLQPEILHSYSFYTNFAAWWATLGSTTLPVGSIRNSFLLERQSNGGVLGRLSARWPAAQICNSFTAERNVQNFSGSFKPSRLYVVPNRLDIERFKLHASLPSEPMLLAVGTLAPRKRWDRMLKVAAALAAKKIKCRIRHAGGGPLLAELRAQAKQLGVEGFVEFLGPRDDIVELMAGSTFLIHTADEEGSPNVVMEAMACGRAVVSTDAGDVPSLVVNGQTGFVVRRGDDETLVERVAQLILDRSLCKRLGEAGWAKAKQEFSLPRLVGETLEVYQQEGWGCKRTPG